MGLAYVVGLVGDDGEGGGLNGIRRWAGGVSTEEVPAASKDIESNIDGNPARRMAVITVVLEYAGAHDKYTGKSNRLGREY